MAPHQTEVVSPLTGGRWVLWEEEPSPTLGQCLLSPSANLHEDKAEREASGRICFGNLCSGSISFSTCFLSLAVTGPGVPPGVEPTFWNDTGFNRKTLWPIPRHSHLWMQLLIGHSPALQVFQRVSSENNLFQAYNFAHVLFSVFVLCRGSFSWRIWVRTTLELWLPKDSWQGWLHFTQFSLRGDWPVSAGMNVRTVRMHRTPLTTLNPDVTVWCPYCTWGSCLMMEQMMAGVALADWAYTPERQLQTHQDSNPQLPCWAVMSVWAGNFPVWDMETNNTVLTPFLLWTEWNGECKLLPPWWAHDKCSVNNNCHLNSCTMSCSWVAVSGRKAHFCPEF